jgi:hypothetical protein
LKFLIALLIRQTLSLSFFFHYQVERHEGVFLTKPNSTGPDISFQFQDCLKKRRARDMHATYHSPATTILCYILSEEVFASYVRSDVSLQLSHQFPAYFRRGVIN